MIPTDPQNLLVDTISIARLFPIPLIKLEPPPTISENLIESHTFHFLSENRLDTSVSYFTSLSGLFTAITLQSRTGHSTYRDVQQLLDVTG